MDVPPDLWMEVIDELPSEIALLNDEGMILFTNRQWRQFGCENGLVEREAVSIGENYLAVSDADDEHAQRVLEGLESLLAGEESQFSLEYPCHSPDEKRWFRMTATTLEHDRERYLVMEHLNITERRLAEIAVREKNAQLEALHGAAHELLEADDLESVASLAVATIDEVLEMPITSLWLHDPDRDVLEPVAATETAERVVGDHPTYSGEESLSWQAFTEGAVHVFDDLSTVPDRYNPDSPIASEILLPVGSHGVFNVGATETGAFDETDVLLAEVWAVTVAGILDRLDRERELREQTRELARQRDRLEEFAEVVSHDLRNPLSVAFGRLELAREKEDNEHLQEVEWALERMNRLIENVLVLAREGETVGETEPVGLADLAETCWSAVDVRGAELHVGTHRTVEADRDRLAQVFENLFRNAIEHGDRDVCVTVGELEDGFYVEDDGPGIPADEREMVLESGYSTSEEGTGFGLAIAERIVEAHGWTIDVTEGAEGGARFEIGEVAFEDGG